MAPIRNSLNYSHLGTQVIHRNVGHHNVVLCFYTLSSYTKLKSKLLQLALAIMLTLLVLYKLAFISKHLTILNIIIMNCSLTF